MDSAQFTIGIHRSASNAHFTFPWKFRMKFVASFYSKFSLLTRLNCAIKSMHLLEYNWTEFKSRFFAVQHDLLANASSICVDIVLNKYIPFPSFISMLFFPSTSSKFSISWENCTHFERFNVISWVLLLSSAISASLHTCSIHNFLRIVLFTEMALMLAQIVFFLLQCKTQTSSKWHNTANKSQFAFII